MTKQIYRMPSATYPGHRYRVTVINGVVRACECARYVKGHKLDCRHANLVRLALLDDRPSTHELVTAPLTVDDLYA